MCCLHTIVANSTLLPWFQQTLSAFTVQNLTAMLQRTAQVFLMTVLRIQFSCCFFEIYLGRTDEILGFTPNCLQKIPKGCKKRWWVCVLSQCGRMSSWRGEFQGGKSFLGVLKLFRGEGNWCSLQDRKVVVEKAPLAGPGLSLGSQLQSMGPSLVSIIIR